MVNELTLAYIETIFEAKNKNFLLRFLTFCSNNKILTIISMALVMLVCSLISIFYFKKVDSIRDSLVTALAIVASGLIALLVIFIQKAIEENQKRLSTQSLLVAFYTEIKECNARYHQIRTTLPGHLKNFVRIFVKNNPFLVYQKNTNNLDKIRDAILVQGIIKIYHLGYDIIETFNYLNYLKSEFTKTIFRIDDFITNGIPHPKDMNSYPSNMIQESIALYQKKIDVMRRQAEYFNELYNKALKGLDKTNLELVSEITIFQGYFKNTGILNPIIN